MMMMVMSYDDRGDVLLKMLLLLMLLESNCLLSGGGGGLQFTNSGLDVLGEGHVLSQGLAQSVEHTAEDPLLGLLQGGGLVGQLAGLLLEIDDVGHVGSPGGLDEHALVDLDGVLQTGAHGGELSHD